MPSDMLNYPASQEDRVVYVKAAADAMATDVTAAQYFYPVLYAAEVVNAQWLSGGTITASDAAYATLIVNKHDGAGGAAVVAASRTTQTTAGGGGGSEAAGVPYPLAPSATVASRQVAAGNVLSFQITKTGAGVVVPAGMVAVTLRLLNP